MPSEWDIGLDGTVHLVGGPRAHEQPVLVDQTATPVLQAALPLLARLERPALLLPGRVVMRDALPEVAFCLSGASRSLPSVPVLRGLKRNVL